MATYTVPDNGLGAYAKVLEASAVDTVQFADSVSAVEVQHDGTDRIYVTTDGSEPTIGGSNCYELPPFPAVRVIVVHQTTPRTPTEVKLISAGTPTYSVARAEGE